MQYLTLLLFKNVIFQRNYEINCTNYDKKKKRNKEIKKDFEGIPKF